MKHTDTIRGHVLEALRATGCLSVQAIAHAYGMSHQTVTRWARAAQLDIPPAAVRIAAGSKEGSARRWPGFAARRDRAAQLRRGGATLAAIAAELGYAHPSGVHYAAAKATKRSRPHAQR